MSAVLAAPLAVEAAAAGAAAATGIFVRLRAQQSGTNAWAGAAVHAMRAASAAARDVFVSAGDMSATASAAAAASARAALAIGRSLFTDRSDRPIQQLRLTVMAMGEVRRQTRTKPEPTHRAHPHALSPQPSAEAAAVYRSRSRLPKPQPSADAAAVCRCRSSLPPRPPPPSAAPPPPPRSPPPHPPPPHPHQVRKDLETELSELIARERSLEKSLPGFLNAERHADKLSELSDLDKKYLFFRPPTHFSRMSHPTFPISHILILFIRIRQVVDDIKALNGESEAFILQEIRELSSSSAPASIFRGVAELNREMWQKRRPTYGRNGSFSRYMSLSTHLAHMPHTPSFSTHLSYILSYISPTFVVWSIFGGARAGARVSMPSARVAQMSATGDDYLNLNIPPEMIPDDIDIGGRTKK